MASVRAQIKVYLFIAWIYVSGKSYSRANELISLVHWTVLFRHPHLWQSVIYLSKWEILTFATLRCPTEIAQFNCGNYKKNAENSTATRSILVGRFFSVFYFVVVGDYEPRGSESFIRGISHPEDSF